MHTEPPARWSRRLPLEGGQRSRRLEGVAQDGPELSRPPPCTAWEPLPLSWRPQGMGSGVFKVPWQDRGWGLGHGPALLPCAPGAPTALTPQHATHTEARRAPRHWSGSISGGRRRVPGMQSSPQAGVWAGAGLGRNTTGGAAPQSAPRPLSVIYLQCKIFPTWSCGAGRGSGCRTAESEMLAPPLGCMATAAQAGPPTRQESTQGDRPATRSLTHPLSYN